MADANKCVGRSGVTDDDQCAATTKFRVNSGNYGVEGYFKTCGRHLSWAVGVWLKKPGHVVNSVTLIEEGRN